MLYFKFAKMAGKGNKGFCEFGYPDEQFKTVVSENLHCAICSCVFKDPVMCKNEHCFCRGCITKHLKNTHTCPSCNQDLTEESLADVPRIVRNLLSEQSIRCDHHERGCEEIVQLGNLASHVAVCGKAPVVCANEECSSEINREDQFRHQGEECRFRKVKCQNCEEMGSMVQEFGTSLGALCEHVEKLNTSVNEQVEKLNTNVNEQLTEVKNRFGEIENRFEKVEMEMETRFERVENRFEKMQNRFEEVENQFLNRDGQDRVHDDRESARSDQATPPDPSSDFKDARNPNKYAYVVAGGFGKKGELLYSVEIFDKDTNSWKQLQPMKKCHANASSVVYNGKVLVTGGTSTQGPVIQNSTEQLSRNSNPFAPPFWSSLPADLPLHLERHRSVLYNDRMFVIGGNSWNDYYSDVIYEIQLHFPFTAKVLVKLPSLTPIQGSGVVLANDKILIFGGRSREVSNHATANVTMYDITKDEFEELAPLPYEVCNMAIVQLGENVILAGGSNKLSHGGRKDTVVSYNIVTQKSTMLPPMKQKRSECCAVVDGNTLVVMGGGRQNGAALNLVEAFDFGTSKWRNLPSMKEARKAFIAEIV